MWKTVAAWVVPGGAGGLGIGTIVILGLIGWALGIDPRILIGGAEMMTGGGSGYEQQQQGRQGAPQDEAGRFASAILGNTEDVWKDGPAAAGQPPIPGRRSSCCSPAPTRSGCGGAQSAMGPFYCPLDQTVYIDLSFFQEMQRRFRAGGDFAYAYVLAHEVGHHVENQLGILPRVQERQRQVGQAEGNQLSVRVELMADCLAGVWAHHSDQRWKSLEQGDIEEAIQAAEAIGDDRLQKQSQGRVVPDSFTHGSSGPARALAHDRLEERPGPGLRHVPGEQPLRLPFSGKGAFRRMGRGWALGHPLRSIARTSLIPTIPLMCRSAEGSMLNAFGFVIEMARQTPVWVWALFAFLMYRGTMALNGSVTSLPRLAIVPVAFAAWGLWSVATGSHEPGLSSLIWAASFAFGAMLGALRTARTPIQVDRPAGLVALPGSPMVLVLVLVVFSVKYALGAWAAIQPGAALSPAFVIYDVGSPERSPGCSPGVF